MWGLPRDVGQQPDPRAGVGFQGASVLFTHSWRPGEMHALCKSPGQPGLWGSSGGAAFYPQGRAGVGGHWHLQAHCCRRRETAGLRRLEGGPGLERWGAGQRQRMIAHPRILSWRIPWTEGPGGLQSMGSQRVRHDGATDATLLGRKDWERGNRGHKQETEPWGTCVNQGP